MKRETSPYNPYKRKAKGKETRPGFFEPIPRPRGRARACTCTYEEAGIAADEIVGNCFPELANSHGYIAMKCRHGNKQRIIDKAYDCASRARQCEIKNGVGAFLKWLDATFPKPPRKGGAR